MYISEFGCGAVFGIVVEFLVLLAMSFYYKKKDKK